MRLSDASVRFALALALAAFAACAGPRVVVPPEARAPAALPEIQTSAHTESQFDAGVETDDALFEQAHDLDLAGHRPEAHELYVRFLKETPRSTRAPHAWVALGDAAFDDPQSSPAKWDEVERLYQQALIAPPPDNQVYGYAWYRLGHVYWNKGDFAKALNAFRKTIEFGVNFSQLPGASNLADSARRDVIAVYPEAGIPGAAYTFFHGIAGDLGGSNDKTFVMMEGLGRRYLELGKWAAARTVFEDLAIRDPQRACAHRVWAKAATDAAANGVLAAPTRIAQDLALCP